MNQPPPIPPPPPNCYPSCQRHQQTARIVRGGIIWGMIIGCFIFGSIVATAIK